jgi:tetratricopeptide (TPR) repeat protein
MTFWEAINLLFQAGEYFYQRGQYREAEPLRKSALVMCEHVLGPEHPDTAQTLGNLAALYHDQGKYELAAPLFQRAMAIYEQKLGADHPSTTRVRENYANLVQKMKQKTKAVRAKPKTPRKQAGK